ncbi:MBL fold metallo-hydrolase [Fulvivirgaceae bacterium BMA10]|uniref:MBL fold metallo-hydrolase n=1 Tax=Splendidivirga corallicola TaxID=3051826 RepID=A0ABT8KH01_9BACT|nr:MBL fold metallo-hydrolase [Fulvivirgaceae bacterium BMA10]
MIVTFLGTGTSQGVPVIGCGCEVCQSLDYRDKRLRTSVHIAVEGKSFVIDSGPDFRQQVLRERIHKLDALIFTHQHKDHTAGMDDVRSYNFKQQKDMPIYAKAEVIEQLKREYAYVFSEVKYPGTPSVEIHEIENRPFQIEGVNITPIYVLHYKLPVFGFRIKDFTYITDTNYIDDKEKEKIIGSEVLVLNALQKEKHISHFNLEEAIAMVEELKPKKAYFTHISHKMGTHREASKELPDNMELAYDGLKIHM